MKSIFFGWCGAGVVGAIIGAFARIDPVSGAGIGMMLYTVLYCLLNGLMIEFKKEFTKLTAQEKEKR